jgi:ubiquinone/menaquinone biosynthesis C-methylase UbiE
MTTDNLGLPFEYQKYPDFFNALNINDDTNKKNAIIENLLKSNKVKTVLDFTCGTGSQVFFLAKHDYQCTGVDFSPALLKMAREKSSQEKVDIQWIDGDMRTLQVGQFDAVITIFNAIGHLTHTDFAVSLKNIHKNLKEGGIYVFDILNAAVMNESTVANLSYHVHKKVSDAQIYSAQCSTFDPKSNRLTSYNMVMIQKRANVPHRFTEKCSLQLYTAEELKEILAQNGFEIVQQYGIDGEEFFSNKTLNILTVARAIKIVA